MGRQVAGALSSQSPAYASLMRLLLTGAGGIKAAMLVALLDSLLLEPKRARHLHTETAVEELTG
ncbi:hypothetical protein FHS00_002407 [Limimaricola variabilis]|uniref:Uncharacterized protein n=1 Tax=Limimaricola variabilis TaxID=1492771 RepID=A0ABR6HQQ0_9RHOB|nr:hypothetical protein [Limimaricola variabilis]MBB3712812.1 hypothetical protein [Limimaricola variabilis]